jgi:glycosyltransferase involved in cell wall biosynthesis
MPGFVKQLISSERPEAGWGWLAAWSLTFTLNLMLAGLVCDVRRLTRSKARVGPSRQKKTPFTPIRLVELELSQPLPDLAPSYDTNARLYRRARALIRLHNQPIGVVDLLLDDDGSLRADLYTAAIWSPLKDTINAHLIQDGLGRVDTLTQAGLQANGEPRCLQERARFLTNDPPMISVVICTHNRTDQLETCLEHLEAQIYPNFEILVIDNAPSTTATAELIARLQSPRIRYIRESRPGLSWARNRSLLAARGVIVAYLDDDERADPYWLTELARGYDMAENVACVTGFILPAELETQAQEWFEQFGGHSKGRGFKQYIFNTTSHRIQNPLLPAPPFGVGANMSFKTDVIRRLGGFDTALGAGTYARGAEDTAAFYDVLMAGYTLLLRPSALMYHYHRRDYAGLRGQLYGYGVGVAAFFLRVILKNPRRLISLLVLLPRLLYYQFSPVSPRSAKMQDDYPSELTWLQRKGLLYGSLAYLRSRWRARAVTRQHGAVDLNALPQTERR